jgi:predicted small metal-binding protein
MAKTYTCDECSREMFADRESVLVEEVQDHAKKEHGMEMEAEQVREGIEDT